jgi:hypothetical protein
MFHRAEATTVSGYWAWVLITLPMASLPFSLAASLTPKRSAYSTSAPLSIIAKVASLALGGSNQLLMKLTVNHLGVGFLGAGHEGVHQAVHLRGWGSRRPCRSVLVMPPAIMPLR